jgi:hydroxymethylpyrimidine/phosphomethylpyrimidine kinase
MEAGRPVVLSIAGLDPSGGAGLLADIKTFEQLKVYGLAVSTAQTVQTADHFFAVRWEKAEDILYAIKTMLTHYDVKAIKIGIVENIEKLARIINFITEENTAIKIVADTVIRSSSGFDFWDEKMNEEVFLKLLPGLHLITPNYEEAIKLIPDAPDAKAAARKLSAYCNVLLKGGHNAEDVGTDYLYLKDGGLAEFRALDAAVYAKHGSGCVLSAAITANLALGNDLFKSCMYAKKYTEQFLKSNETLLGYHHV